MPRDPGAYLNRSWQAFILSNWAYHFYRLEYLYKYRLSELLYLSVQNKKVGQEIIDELYEEFFGKGQKQEDVKLKQENIEELIEYYKHVFES